MMPPAQRAEARKLCDEAITAPWYAVEDEDSGCWDVHDANGMFVCGVGEDGGSARFIAASRILVPALLADCERLERELAEITTALRCEQIRSEDRGNSFKRLQAELGELREATAVTAWAKDVRLAAKFAADLKEMATARDEACDGWARCRASYYAHNKDSPGYGWSGDRIAALRAVGGEK